MLQISLLFNDFYNAVKVAIQDEDKSKGFIILEKDCLLFRNMKEKMTYCEPMSIFNRMYLSKIYIQLDDDYWVLGFEGSFENTEKIIEEIDNRMPYPAIEYDTDLDDSIYPIDNIDAVIALCELSN